MGRLAPGGEDKPTATQTDGQTQSSGKQPARWAYRVRGAGDRQRGTRAGVLSRLGGAGMKRMDRLGVGAERTDGLQGSAVMREREQTEAGQGIGGQMDAGPAVPARPGPGRGRAAAAGAGGGGRCLWSCRLRWNYEK